MPSVVSVSCPFVLLPLPLDKEGMSPASWLNLLRLHLPLYSLKALGKCSFWHSGQAPKSHTPCNQHFIDVEPGKISENRAHAFDWVRESGKDKPGLTVPSPSPSLLRLSSPHHPVLLVQKALTSSSSCAQCWSGLDSDSLVDSLVKKRTQPLKPIILFQWQKSKCFTNSWFSRSSCF